MTGITNTRINTYRRQYVSLVEYNFGSKRMEIGKKKEKLRQNATLEVCVAAQIHAPQHVVVIIYPNQIESTKSCISKQLDFRKSGIEAL